MFQLSRRTSRCGPRFLALALVTTISASTLGFALVACESATNLDVTYGDASAALFEASANDAEAGVVVTPPGPPGQGVLPGCPCDESAGLGCCMPAAGKPFCTEDTAVCKQAAGTHLKCVRPDPSTESVCCWNPDTQVGAVTALAAFCDGGVAACTTDGDCAGTGQACKTSSCFGGTLVIGACGPTAPACPQP